MSATNQSIRMYQDTVSDSGVRCFVKVSSNMVLLNTLSNLKLQIRRTY